MQLSGRAYLPGARFGGMAGAGRFDSSRSGACSCSWTRSSHPPGLDSGHLLGRRRLEPPLQQARSARSTRKPFKLPSTVNAIRSCWNHSFASASISGAVTDSIWSLISSSVRTWPWIAS